MVATVALWFITLFTSSIVFFNAARRRRAGLLRKVLTMTLVLHALVFCWSIAAATGCTDALFLHPTRDVRGAGGFEERFIASADGSNIQVCVARSPGPSTMPLTTGPTPGASAAPATAPTATPPTVPTTAPTLFVLQFCGNEQRAEDVAPAVARQWGDRIVEVWAVNHPGYGKSDGPARLRRLTPAGLAVFDALKQVAGERPIVVGGRSIGCTVALAVAAQREAAGVVLQNPPALKQIVLRQFGWWNLWLLAVPVSASVPGELDSPAVAQTAHAPAVFILADADDKVIPKYQQAVLDAYAGPKRTLHLAGARHSTTVEAGPDLDELRKDFDWLLANDKTATRMRN